MSAEPSLAWSTPSSWAGAALDDPEALLDDHAHCELGAAAAAQSLIARVPHHSRLVDRLSALAAEEMRHFRRVHRLLVRRGGRLRPPRTNPYTAGLLAVVREPREERLLDRLLVASLIERRSHERFGLLAEGAESTHPELAELYQRLGPSEAGHGALFLDLARELFDRGACDARLAVLRHREADVIRALDFEPRVHSGPPVSVVAEPLLQETRR